MTSLYAYAMRAAALEGKSQAMAGHGKLWQAIQPNSDGLQPLLAMASNLLAMASHLEATASSLVTSFGKPHQVAPILAALWLSVALSVWLQHASALDVCRSCIRPGI